MSRFQFHPASAIAAMLALCLCPVAQARAPRQPAPQVPTQRTVADDAVEPGRVADSAVGRAGKRQSRFEAKGIRPMTRINDRIANRVQSRIRNRIDAGYSPDANASAPFAVAAEEARRPGRPR